MTKKKTVITIEITTEEWVRKLNALGKYLDDCFLMVHPSGWDDIARQNRREIEQYKRLAKYKPCDEEATLRQLDVGYENKEF